MLGATQYFYEGGRILFPALALAGWGSGWRCGGAPVDPGADPDGAGFVIIAVPVYYTLEGMDFPLFDRIDKADLDAHYWEKARRDNVQARIARFEHSMLHYVNSPENTLFHFYLYYGGKHPLLLVYVIPPFLLGLVIAAGQWRRPGVVLVLWMAGRRWKRAAARKRGVGALCAGVPGGGDPGRAGDTGATGFALARGEIGFAEGERGR